MINTNNTTTDTIQKLETKVCGRCGGSGHYSYCQMYGTICFGCAGRKVVFTKRGHATNEYLRKLRSKPASEIQVGDQIQRDSITMGGQLYTAWYTVASIASNLSDRTLRIDLTSKKAGGLLLSNADPELADFLPGRPRPQQRRSGPGHRSSEPGAG